jgi:hypothetical protein
MKKVSGLILKVLSVVILLILIAVFTVPVIFKDKIRTKVVQVITESVNADVKFGDYKLGFFRNFPNMTFSLDNVSVVGVDNFENDTLAALKTFDLVFNLGSLLGRSGYEVKSIIADHVQVNAIVLEDGSANWDIMKDTTETAAEEESESGMKILLKKVNVLNSEVSYTDKSSDMATYLKDLNFNLSGDMTMSETDLQIAARIGEFTYIMEGMKYLNNVVIDSRIDMQADLDKMKFTFKENYLALNDLKLIFSGNVSMPGDDIETDLNFGAEKSSFKSLLSLIPAVYMTDYQDLTTTGEFSLSGTAKGIYSDADSSLPDIALDLTVENGFISYPDLPEQIKNINIRSKVAVDGKVIDRTSVDIERFHFDLAGSPFDMTFSLRTPISDPDVKASMKGKIDLAALSKAVPMDSINLSGIINMAVSIAGKMSMIEKKQYDKFQASGTMDIRNMLVAMTGYPDVKINSADFQFTPAYTAMNNADLVIGSKSDFKLNGNLENYLPYVFSDGVLQGKLSLNSKLIDATDIMSAMPADTSAVSDTTSLAVIHIPENIDFDFTATADKFVYDNINASELSGHVVVKDGVLSLKETVMEILGGKIAMNAVYDTRDTLKPKMDADFKIENIDVKNSFSAFNTVQKLTPAAKGIDGKVSAQFSLQSLLGKDMMPVISSLGGAGKLQSSALTLVESLTFDKIREAMKLGEKFNNTFRDLNISFRMENGRIFVNPFDTKMGSIKLNISGDQGFDQTLNYLVKTEIPRSELGGSANSLIDNLSAQAAGFGISFKPADVLKVNLKVGGIFGKPVVTPVFGSSSETGTGTAVTSVKEAAKQTIDNTVDKTKDKARAEAEIQGDKLVREAEEKALLLKEEAAKAADKIRTEAEAQAQKILSAAEPKGVLAKAAAQKSADALRKEADKRALQIEAEADSKGNKLIEEAKAKKADLISKI